METTININYEDIPVEVEYIVSGAHRPERAYLSNGDPGYPAEFPELEITSIIGIDDDKSYLSEISFDMLNIIISECWDDLEKYQD
jgi:hypothetical protein